MGAESFADLNECLAFLQAAWLSHHTAWLKFAFIGYDDMTRLSRGHSETENAPIGIIC
jgi:hypothetical protein